MATDLAGRIQELLEQREQHTSALERIEETLSGIGALLGVSLNGTGKKRGRPPKSASGAPVAPAKRRKRSRGSYDTTAEEFVLSFVKQKKNPTTKEINGHWVEAGRGNKADNTLVKLVKDKKLKRIPLEGERGSRYALD